MNHFKFFVFIFVVLLAGCQKAPQIEAEGKKKTEVPKVPQTREERVAASVKGVVSIESKTSTGTEVDLRPLKGYKLNDLYAEYFGLTKGEFVPDFTVVSFEEVLSAMYQKKIKFRRCYINSKKIEVCREATDTVLSQAPELYSRYIKGDKKKMSLKEFIKIAEGKMASSKKSLDWAKVCARYKLNQEKCRLLQVVVSELNGKDMIAYGMTELLPSSDGRLNVIYMDLLLKNAGSEFLHHVPALGDELASLGLYQFTMYALRDDDTVREGASIINSFVMDGGEKIPGSVVMLTGNDHHVAAFYFAVHNLARLMAKLSPKGVTNLASKYKNHKDEIVIFIAASHHAPAAAVRKTAIWVNSDFRGNILDAYSKHRIRTYGIKTKANLLAIKQLK